MSELAIKQERVLNFMQAQGLDAVVLGSRANFAWYTGGRDNHVVTASGDGFASVLIMPEKNCCIATDIESPRIRTEEAPEGFDTVEYPWHKPEELETVIRDLTGAGRVGTDSAIEGLEALSSDFEALRYSLTEEEVQRYRQLGNDCTRSLTKVCRGLKAGMTEHEIAAQLAGEVMAQGIEPAVVLIACDERIRQFRHPIPTDNRLQQYAMLVLCGQRHGLILSCTRFVHLGPLDSDLIARHEAVQQVDTAVISATQVGRSYGDIFKTIQQAYAKVGFPEEWRLHHQGGPAGYGARDFLATAEEERIVQVNQAAAWNPSITGTKSEDTIIATEEGPEIISTDPEWPACSAAYESHELIRPRMLVL